MKINFGCGVVQPKDWANVDNDPQYNAYYDSLKNIESNSVDMMVAHCSLQMTVYPALPDLLKELLRVLKPGATLRISLPDIIRGFKSYAENDISFFPNHEENLDDRFSGWINWYSTARTLILPTTLSRKLIDVGFSKVIRVDFKQTQCEDFIICDLDTRENECYFLEAVK